MVVVDVHSCLLTSETLASAVTEYALAGLAESKSILNRCLPSESVFPMKDSVCFSLPVRVRAGHHGTHSPNGYSARFGGVKLAGVDVTLQFTSASLSAPPV